MHLFLKLIHPCMYYQLNLQCPTYQFHVIILVGFIVVQNGTKFLDLHSLSEFFFFRNTKYQTISKRVKSKIKT